MTTHKEKETIRIEGGDGKAFHMQSQACARIVNLEGSQVVDMWAFGFHDLKEHLSTEHTRSCIEKLCPAVGDAFYSNHRRPLLTLIDDTSPGIHDLLLSACDEERYRLLGHQGWHRNCADNLRQCFSPFGELDGNIPSPVNFFENVSLSGANHLQIEPPKVSAGQHVTVRAERELVVIVSVCPMDIALTNGPDRRPKPIMIKIWDSEPGD